MKKFSFCAIALFPLLLWTGHVTAQPAVTKRIIEISRTDNRVMHHLDILCNRFGGRLVGSDAYENAARWMLHEYSRWGIKAHLEEAGQVPVGFNRGPWFGRLIGGDRPMNLHFVTPSYTSGTKGLQRGHVLMEPTDEQEFRRMKHRLQGAWVLVAGQSNGWPLSATAVKNSNFTDEKGKNIHIPGRFYTEMCQAGVLGFIQRAEVPLRALYHRELICDSLTDFDHLPEVCDIKLDQNQYDQIERMVKERRDIWLEFDIRNHFKLGPVKYHNVVASIPGTKFPDEYVIISGHLDAYDVGTGGVDCGTGIGPMMEAARLLALAGAKPKRTIVFVAFAAEEFGLLGSQAFVRAHADWMPRISYLFNRDYGPLPPTGISVPPAMKDDFEQVCKPIKDLNPDFPFEVTVTNRSLRFGAARTDAAVFAAQGVPALPFSESDVKGYNFSYGEIWHTERDLYTKNIAEYQEHAAAVTAIVALGIANLDHLLSREEMHTEE